MAPGSRAAQVLQPGDVNWIPLRAECGYPLSLRGRGEYLETDPMESYDVSDLHPQIEQQLSEIFEARRAELKENPRGWLND